MTGAASDIRSRHVNIHIGDLGPRQNLPGTGNLFLQ